MKAADVTPFVFVMKAAIFNDHSSKHRLFLPGICIGFLKMLLFFSLTGFSGPGTFLLSSVEPSFVWFCGSLDAASPCGWTTLNPLFSKAC